MTFDQRSCPSRADTMQSGACQRCSKPRQTGTAVPNGTVERSPVTLRGATGTRREVDSPQLRCVRQRIWFCGEPRVAKDPLHVATEHARPLSISIRSGADLMRSTLYYWLQRALIGSSPFSVVQRVALSQTMEPVDCIPRRWSASPCLVHRRLAISTAWSLSHSIALFPQTTSIVTLSMRRVV